MPASDGERLALGFDSGSVALKVVVADLAGNLLEQSYTRTQGQPVETALRVLGEVLRRHGAEAFDLVAGTGSSGRLIGELLGATLVNEVICQATAIGQLNPEVRTLIEMGGQDSKLIVLPGGLSSGEPRSGRRRPPEGHLDGLGNGPADNRPVVDFAMNTACAAGTGSFLDQQASRLGIRIEGEFGRLALQCQSPPRVAGRCSVFAKSDMIHLQQQGASLSDIIAGLCLGLARNLKSNLGRGIELQRPIAFCGGVAANKGLVRALEEVFELGPGELIVPDCHAQSGALGAVLVTLRERARRGPEHGRPPGGRVDLAPLGSYLEQGRTIGHRLSRLTPSSEGNPDRSVPSREQLEALARDGPIDAYLGLDVGSISTNVAVIDNQDRVLAKVYLMTAGRPLEAVRTALRQIGEWLGQLVRVRGAASTGSGRYLTGDFVGADLVINEITAQATAAALIDPEVDTIFEIGGQDSKYISLDGGVVVDFEMNHACAAGTGSFLEEQAERLGIRIEEQFGRLALASRAPIRLGERCTVFMESDLLSYQQQRARTEDLVAGLCYSIVSNYINRVVGHRRIGRRIFFQGGTAFNRGVVAAFEQVTGRKITVPPHHEVTGAIGAAVLARRHQQQRGARLGGPSRCSARPFGPDGNAPRSDPAQSSFGGFELADVQYTQRSFECEHCANHCEINEVTVAGRDPLCYGSRCDRYNLKKDRGRDETIPNLFAERHRLLLQHANLKPDRIAGRPAVGVPLALANYQLLPLWGTLLGELGLNVVVSPVSNQRIIRAGVEAVLSTPCFPVKVAHGHVLDLVDKGVDYLWLPSVITMSQECAEHPDNKLCPYVTAIPYQVAAAIEHRGRKRGDQERAISDQGRAISDERPGRSDLLAAGRRPQAPEMLKPAVRFHEGPRGLRKTLKPLGRQLGVSPARLRRAVARAWQAQAEFEESCRRRGREVFDGLEPGRRAVVIVSRPYNGCDPGAFLNLPEKLRRLGVLPIPMDFLDLRSRGIVGDQVFHNMYWRYGQRILRAADIIRHDPRLHAIYLSNFSCGPDSFLIGFFKRLMDPKPSLVLEIDEHSADAGVVTRLEAFLESLSGAPSGRLPRRPPLRAFSSERHSARTAPDGCSEDGQPRTIYVPWMGDHSHALAAAFRATGRPSEVMPVADEQSMQLGRSHSSGKECLPCIITAGDMIRVTEQPGFDPRRAAFFMPSTAGPCRFGQYSCMHQLLLADLGYPDVPVVALNQDKRFYDQCKELHGEVLRYAWYGACAYDVLQKACLAIRPYETRPGRTDETYRRWAQRTAELIERRPTLEQVEDHLSRAAAEFAAIPADGRPFGGLLHECPSEGQPRPRIGIVGEIYVRHHSLANNDLIRQLEQLGAETALAPFTEWMYYTNFTRMHQARRDFALGQWLSNFLQDHFQHKWHRRLIAPFEPLLGPLEEAPIEELLGLAAPYLHPSFEGEAILSVGKTIEFCRHGCHGVVNVMPFSCMPSTIVGGVMKKLAAALAEMPTLSISYDGQQDPMLRTRLEAFVYQARAYQQKGDRRAY